ncbi:MAG: glycosyltransferase family 39 protein [Nitrospiraceae bacterium]|nr:glycosyltransferase family 39 protein [Nitrospiraceae bacterium]
MVSEGRQKSCSVLHKPVFWLGVIILTAAAARVYHITYPPFDTWAFRQTATAGLIRDYYRHGINIFYPTLITLGKPGYMVQEFPLYQALSALLYKIFIPSLITARIFTIITGLLSAWFVYRISIRFLDKRSSLLASFFFAFMPLDIFFQRVPMQDPLTVLLSLMMLDFFIEGIEGKKFYFIPGALAASLGLMMKSPFIGPLFLPVLYLAWKKRGRPGAAQSYAGLLLAFVIPAAAMVLWQRHANFVNDIYCRKDGYPFKDIYPTLVVKLHPFNTWYFGTVGQRLEMANYLLLLRRAAMYVLTPIGAAFFAAGAVRLALEKRGAFLFIWLFSLCAMVMMIFNLYVVHNYYLLPFCPVLAVFCGAGAGLLLDYMDKHGRAVSAVSALVIAAAFLLSGTSIAKGFYNGNGLIGIGEFIGQHTQRGALVAVASPDTNLYSPVQLYFADRHGFAVPLDRMNGQMMDYLRSQDVRYLAKIEPAGYTITTRIYDISGKEPVLVASSTGHAGP